MRRILEACSWRLTVFVGGYAESNGEQLPHILTLILMMMEMVAKGPSPGLLSVSHFHTIRTVITSGGVRVHLVKVWAMML